MVNGQVDKLLFEGGFARAFQTSPTTDRFVFYYLNQDHLGNNREVVDAAGVVRQVTSYYPSGTPYADPAAVMDADLQPYKYNGKELDRMHGLDTYDYGARHYNPILGRWDRMDPLCEKYYSVSPYAYCHNNPVMYIDPDGRVYGQKASNLSGRLAKRLRRTD
jgi:RHS repeat-associated protein